MIAWEVLRETLMITAFVAVMMLVIEYVNVFSGGAWMRTLAASRWRQYLLGAGLGAIPGCLGAFVVVSLYAHRRVTIGTVVAAMVATMGDATFVMLAVVPETALLLIVALALLGALAGWLADLVVPGPVPTRADDSCEFPIHGESWQEACVPQGQLLSQWRAPSAHRAILAVVSACFLAGLVAGQVGPEEWGWVRVTLLVVTAFGLFIVATVSDHFLDEHLWEHVLKLHVPRIFLWTLGALTALAVLDHFVDIEALVRANPWIVLLVAAVIGLIPESGPHIVFVTLFASGAIPLSVLVTSSIVQDGHGMIPLLAHSRKDFVVVKLINAALGVAVGAGLLLAGW